MPRNELARLIKDLESQMKAAARDLEFEKAALLRDQIIELRRMIEVDPGNGFLGGSSERLRREGDLQRFITRRQTFVRLLAYSLVLFGVVCQPLAAIATTEPPDPAAQGEVTPELPPARYTDIESTRVHLRADIDAAR
ncbi:MAG: hypothetical protein KatS3mg059_0255 [Thermomicrobiales bacterium]|nr:MAG: hypothetical protein KatS3mg059_0255 [Thermomicrobiales bacterium]